MRDQKKIALLQVLADPDSVDMQEPPITEKLDDLIDILQIAFVKIAQYKTQGMMPGVTEYDEKEMAKRIFVKAVTTYGCLQQWLLLNMHVDLDKPIDIAKYH